MTYNILKKGDEAKVGPNGIAGTQLCTGDIVRITSIQCYEPIYRFRVVKTKCGLRMTGVYSGYTGDLTIYHKDWPTRAKELRKEIKEHRATLKCMESELDMLENYKDEEDYLAHKMSKILENKNEPEAIRTLLKEFKKSDLL